MINFRKLKQDFPPAILSDGRELFERGVVTTSKIISIDTTSLRLGCRVTGNYENTYECELEIDRMDSAMTDSNCDCPYNYDCIHLAAILFHLEKHLDSIIVKFSNESNLEEDEKIEDEEKEILRETFAKAASQETRRRSAQYNIELLSEYAKASKILGESPFFIPPETHQENKAELAVIFSKPKPLSNSEDQTLEIQLALRLPFRSKPLHIPNFREFCEAVRYHNPLRISGRQYFFTMRSFDRHGMDILNMVMTHARFNQATDQEERSKRSAHVSVEAFGNILSHTHNLVTKQASSPTFENKSASLKHLPCLYIDNLETPLSFSLQTASLLFDIERLDMPEPKLFLSPFIVINKQDPISPQETILFESLHPGVIFEGIYYRFPSRIRRIHLKYIQHIREMAIPEHLFGSFVENALPELMRIAEVRNSNSIESFVTIPFVGDLQARCDISYLNGELDATLYFIYDNIEVPVAPKQLTFNLIEKFKTSEGILARNLTEEQEIIKALFLDFLFIEEQGTFTLKTEKKIVEFMTETVPAYQDKVNFNCPENLLDRFIYDKTFFELNLKTSPSLGYYKMELVVNGDLNGIKVDLLWECLSAKKSFIELQKNKTGKKLPNTTKILVLNLETLGPLVQIFDDLGILKLNNQSIDRPLWSLASINKDLFKDLPIKFTLSKDVKALQEQILGHKPLQPSAVPKDVNAKLRAYQKDGIHWLERLRHMHLSGILADDMGLGKTLQAIIAVTQSKKIDHKGIALIVCPTSLLYNWKEEFNKFNPGLKPLIVDGTPAQRKKLLKAIKKYDVIITSYTLLQKDIEIHKKETFSYAILDEAQHIKNRSTRNAKSAKLIKAKHRLILTGTPIENSLEELWSLFDFLMPGLLSSYPRFVEKYLRNPNFENGKNLKGLQQKISPFILRRMKSDVLDDLPPISELVYHCHLTNTQQDLYKSYAESARKELTALVNKEGFAKVQIHVLATLTRLKQICCHPAIFAKEHAEEGDSAKYEMLMELLQTLIESRHKAVIFSQYTKMLNILRQDLTKRGVRFSYLDGSSKNRLDIVKEFNEDQEIPVFLVSLKAGGSGLNIVGADTVIHYDMWWNPAVENQATDRVHRIGQKKAVSSYKLVTLNSIEEKILNLQNRKKGLVRQVINNDDEAMSKLTWEEVLELLQT